MKDNNISQRFIVVVSCSENTHSTHYIYIYIYYNLNEYFRANESLYFGHMKKTMDKSNNTEMLDAESSGNRIRFMNNKSINFGKEEQNRN